MQAIGTTVGAYRLERLLGKGSTGAVYEAEDVHLRRRVALKVMSEELAGDERFRRRFLQESQLAASLDHPHIVPVYAAGEDDGLLYLAMRLIEGADLRGLLASRHHLEPRRTMDLLRQVAGALDAAAGIGLVHRDVKPANILIGSTPPERAYLCDFGLAKHASGVDSLTGERSFVGTISYIAPEQIEGGPVDARADQYSLACVLYECLTGIKPYDRESELQTLFAHLREDVPRVSDVEPGLGPAIDGVVARALAKDPAGRFDSCGALILAAGEALGVEVAAPVRQPPSQPSRRRPLGRRRDVRALAGIAVALAIAAAVAAVLTSRGGEASPSVAPHALAVFDPDSGRLKWQVAFESDPDDAIVRGRTAYVGLGAEGNVARVDLDARRVTGRIRMPDGQHLGPVVGDTMWTSGADDTVVPVDIRYGTPSEPIQLDRTGRYAVVDNERGEPSIAVGGNAIWIAYGTPPRVARVDPSTRKVIATILLPLPPSAQWCCGVIAYGDGDVWVADRASGNLWRIDPATNEVIATGTVNGFWVEDLAAGGGYAWAPRNNDAGVWRIDRTLRETRLIPTGVWPLDATFRDGRAWVANRNDGTVTEVDPATGDTTTVDVGGAPVAAVGSDDELVVALAARPPDPYAGLDGEIATVFARNDPLLPPDPAMGFPDFYERIQIHDAIGLRLVRHADGDGDGVQTVVGDGADLPTVADGGRTWRFRIRQGYRFSPPSGAPVTAAVFRDSIERALSPAWGGEDFSAFPVYLDDLVGFDEFRSGTAQHIRGLRVEGDALVFRLKQPRRDLAARLALQPFAAVPPGTPITPGGLDDPIPSAGPYYLASHVENGHAVLKRNPNYPGPRKAGFDAFVWRMLIANDPAIARVEAGEGDVVAQFHEQVTGATSPLLVRGGALDRRYGRGDQPRYFWAGNSFTWFLRFNTVRGPFQDVRLRRAVSFAIDRAALAGYWDGTPADLFIPPGVAAHRPQGTIFPLDRARPAEARRLARGFRGTVTLATDPRAAQQGMAETIKRQLARIGVTVKIVYDYARRENAIRYDMVLDTWLFDYVDVGITFGPILDPDTWYGPYGIVDPPLFTDPKWLARIRAVEQLPGKQREDAYARLDRDLATGPLPIAALGHDGLATFFSERVGCPQAVGVNAQVDLAALCPR